MLKLFEAGKPSDPLLTPTNWPGRECVLVLLTDKESFMRLAGITATTVPSHNFSFEKQPMLTITRSKPQFRHCFLSRGFDGPLFPSTSAELKPEFATSAIVAEIQTGSKHVSAGLIQFSRSRYAGKIRDHLISIKLGISAADRNERPGDLLEDLRWSKTQLLSNMPPTPPVKTPATNKNNLCTTPIVSLDALFSKVLS